jgi:hypothetical protein
VLVGVVVGVVVGGVVVGVVVGGTVVGVVVGGVVVGVVVVGGVVVAGGEPVDTTMLTAEFFAALTPAAGSDETT